VNLRQDAPEPALILDLLGLCDILKLNADELPVVAALAGVPPDPEALRAAFNLRVVALTLGPAGSLLCTATERLEEPGLAVSVADSVGAGDAFAAALAAGMLQGLDLRNVHRRAARLAAFVCTQDGATPETGTFIRQDPCFR
jgi:fructokinase